MGGKQRVHMIGIGGSGMSPIAKVLLEQQWEVSGSDLHDSATLQNLQALGARVWVGHDAAHLDHPDFIVVSTAISPDNPEVVAAKNMGIKVIHRSEMLALLLNQKRGIAIAGAHGKTTITSMISLVLERAGLDPTVVIGGELSDIGGSARSGQSDFLVAEADESDGSFLRYRPYVAVISNIEADHLENYGGQFSQVVATFAHFLANVKPDGLAVLGTDDPVVREIMTQAKVPVVTYGLNEGEYFAQTIQPGSQGFRFELFVSGVSHGWVELRVPGRHNVANALATIAVAHKLGVDIERIKAALKDFHGAKRRFQFIGDVGGIMVIDDYAHHPTEIMATIRAAKEGWNRRVVAIFQPHRYTRTHFLFNEFAKAFDQADEVVIANIYSPPPDKPIPGVTAQRLAQAISVETGREVRQFDTKEEIIQDLSSRLRPGDMVITMGAGDIWMVGQGLVESLKKSIDDSVR